MTIPPHVQFSINVRGLVHHKSREAKLNYLNHLIKTQKPDIIHIQEHHFKSNSEMMKAFRRFGGKVVGASLATQADPYAGVLSLIPPNSSLLGLVEEHTTSQSGRYAMIRIKTPTQLNHVLNIYAPASSKGAREAFFSDLTDAPCMLEPCILAVGDWNFVTGRLDRLSVNGHSDPPPHPYAENYLEMHDLIDIFRYYDDESVIMTYKSEGLQRWARLDRWYAQPDLLDLCTVLPNLSAAGISDHEIIRLQYGNPFKPDEPINPIYRMSVPLIKQLGIDKSYVRVTSESLLNIHANKIRAESDPAQVLKLYDSLKADLIAYYKYLDKIHWDLRAQRMRIAIKLSKFDTSPDAPPISSQLVQKERARVYLKGLQRKLKLERLYFKIKYSRPQGTA